MTPEIALEPVDAVRVTILMDNVTDPLIPDQDRVTRLSWPKALAGAVPRVATAFTPDGVPDALVAEPGFSALVRVEKNGRERTLLFDTDGHWDHVTGMEGVAKALGRRNLPVLIHPEFWARRRISFPGLDPVELPSTSRSALESAGFEVVEEQQPSFLLDGSVLITGEVDRTTDFETGFKGHEAHRGGWEPDPLILDDQALVARVGDRGLFVLSGCGHAGIVNTVRHAQKLTGERRLAAIVGGFHLSGPMFETIIPPTVAAFDELSPALLVPAHCTGWKAVQQLATRFPDAFVPNAVGTTIEVS
jgi:7,8-dihydropterin-6-yl-methyl-4-(beta-D-ribofuranosyl)aminobenzene 5'-phosphate synthase